MNNKKFWISFTIIFLVILGLVGFSPKEEFDLFSSEDLIKIDIMKYPNESNLTTINDYQELVNIVETIKLDSKKTRKESYGESPLNIDNYIVLELFYSNDFRELAYVYNKDNKHYIEQPYTYIWQITEESYDKLNTLLNN